MTKIFVAYWSLSDVNDFLSILLIAHWLPNEYPLIIHWLDIYYYAAYQL